MVGPVAQGIRVNFYVTAGEVSLPKMRGQLTHELHVADLEPGWPTTISPTMGLPIFGLFDSVQRLDVYDKTLPLRIGKSDIFRPASTRHNTPAPG